MHRLTLAKIFIGILFTLGLILGILQHNNDPYFGSTKTSYNFAASDKSLSTYFKQAEDLAKKTDTKANVSFLAVGDIMLSRNVAGEIQKAKNINLPYEKMAEILKSTDFNFGNFESPFYKISKNCLASEAVGIIGGHSLVFGSPCLYVKGLRDYNFQILNLANNHALDQGLVGLKFTTSLLSDPNVAIQHIGVGENLDDAWKPAIVEAKGMKICFIGASYSSINDGGKATNEYVARIEDAENLKSSILNLKSKCDFVVVTMHAGTEYVRKPNQAQITFAHAAIDAGADMIIGAHPHWVQTIERYAPNCPSPIHGEGGSSASEEQESLKCGDPKYIFYSLGNFIFDQMWSQDTREGLTLKINLSKSIAPNLQGNHQPAKLESVELIPIIIDNYSTPRPATETESKKILEKIGEKEKILY